LGSLPKTYIPKERLSSAPFGSCTLYSLEQLAFIISAIAMFNHGLVFEPLISENLLTLWYDQAKCTNGG